MRRVLLATIGSHGDVMPFVWLAEELDRRGLSVCLATSVDWRTRAEEGGLQFLPIPPVLRFEGTTLADEITQSPKDSLVLFEDYIAPAIPHAFDILSEAIRDFDLVIYSALAHAAYLAADRHCIPSWAAILSPMSLWSAYDPPFLPDVPFKHAPDNPSACGWNRGLIRSLVETSEGSARPVHDLVRRHNLPRRPGCLLRGCLSRQRNLALFPSFFGKPQPDWPINTVQCDFPMANSNRFESDIDAFLTSGSSPIVVALGSVVSHQSNRIIPDILRSTKRVGARILVLGGSRFNGRLQEYEGSEIMLSDYAPFDRVFSRAAVVLHSGGVGATAAALQSGRPTIVLPQYYDQFDNARRAAACSSLCTYLGRPIRFNELQRTVEKMYALADPLEAKVAGVFDKGFDGITNTADEIETAPLIYNL